MRLLLTIFLAFSIPENDCSTFYLIRHAEKVRTNKSDRDPALNEKGIIRALNWKEYFINKNKKKIPFLFSYLTYKPRTDILTESQQYRLCLDLLNEGYIVYCSDSSLKDQCDPRIVYEEPTQEVFEIKL